MMNEGCRGMQSDQNHHPVRKQVMRLLDITRKGAISRPGRGDFEQAVDWQRVPFANCTVMPTIGTAMSSA